MTLLSPDGGIIHPSILDTLARAGHMAEILVADAFYSTATAVNPRARIVHLALTAGAPTSTDVISVLAGAIPVEEVTRMRPETPNESHPVFAEVDGALAGTGAASAWLDRQDFYDRARGENLALCIATGDTRRFANALLRIGGPRRRREP